MPQRLEFGKYKDYLWSDIPEEYIEWLIASSQRTIQLAQAELDRRDALREVGMDPVEKELKTWFRERTKQFHPDRGGSHEDMLRINQLNDCFQEMLRIYKLHRGAY